MTAVFDETAGLSTRCFGGFGKREAGLGNPVKLETARKATIAVLAVTIFSAGFFAVALAQQAVPPAAPTAPKVAKPARRVPATSPAAEPAAAQAAPAAPRAANPASSPHMPRFVFSPWAKFCGKGRDAQANQTCYTGGDAHTEAGQPLVGAALIEPEGEAKKLFRITLPNPLLLEYGARVIVDQQPPMTAPFFTCVAKGCMADYEATPDLIGKLKHGRTLTIQAINLAGAALSFPLPLMDFAKANEGPPTDPKVLEEQQQTQQEEKLQDEVQKRADDVLKRLESQDRAAPTPSR
jgi:invasion protein IalB